MNRNPLPQYRRIGLALAVALAFAGNPASAEVSDADILNDASTKGECVAVIN